MLQTTQLCLDMIIILIFKFFSPQYMQEENIFDRSKFTGLRKLVFKGKFMKIAKFWRKAAKNSKQRFYKLRQWSQTEKAYLAKLILLRDQVKKPLRQSHLISEFQQTIIFPNLESMIQLASQMQNKINSLLSKWNPTKTQLFQTVDQLIIYLKIYKQYSNNFNQSDKIVQQLKKNPKFGEVVTVMNVEDYLIKPVQRPLQYKLFLSDYLRLLPKNHIDKQNLRKALDKLLKIADEINDFVQKQLRAQKMIALDNLFGNIIQSSRQYRSQFVANHTEFSCKVYVFNDLLFIVKVISEIKEEKFKYLHLCAGSYVIHQPDNKTFKNRIYICGKYESVHLTLNCKEDAIHAHDTIQQLIADLYHKQHVRVGLLTQMKNRKQIMNMSMNRHSLTNDYKWKQQTDYQLRLIIQVIGIDKRLYDKQWKITYIVKIQQGRPEVIYQIAFFSLEQLKLIQKYIKQVYPNLQIPSLQTKLKGMSYQDPKTDFTKYFEYKSILIQDFLNFCLRSPQISKRPELILFKLRLHQSLWDYLNRSVTDCTCQACLNAQQLNSIQGYKKQKENIRKQKYQFCIVNAFLTQNAFPMMIKPADFKKLSLQQKLIYAKCKSRRIDYGLQNRPRFGKKIEFFVNLELVGEQTQFYFDSATVNDTCRQVVEEICNKKGIKGCLDFCLFYVHGKHQFCLDDDEYIYDCVKHLQSDLAKLQPDKRLSAVQRASIFNTFSKNMDDFGDTLNDYSITQKGKIYLRKYIYLQPKLQMNACKENPERYQIILGEMLRRFKKQILLLDVEQIKIFCALFYAAEQFNTIIFSKNIFINEEKLKTVIPQSKWNFINSAFVEEVKSIIEKQAKPCSHIILIYQKILEKFGDKVSSYTQYFAGQVEDQSVIQAKQKNVIVGINYKKLTIGHRFMNKILFEVPLSSLEYRVTGDLLLISNNQTTIKIIRSGWLLLQELIKKYRVIQQADNANS